MMSENRRKTLVAFTSYDWESVLVYLRFRAPAEMAGWQVLPGHDGERLIPDRIERADVVLFQRDVPRLAALYQQALETARRLGKPVVYEIDDWLLGVPDEHPFQDQYAGVLNGMLTAIYEADKVVVSTETLRRKIGVFRPDAVVWPNFLLDNVWKLQPPRKPGKSGEVVLGYMGTATHASDLQSILPVFKRLLETYEGRLRINFWGVRPPAPLAEHPAVVWDERHINDYRAFVSHFMQQRADIWLAPLEDTEFNRCKSALKFIEYSAMGGVGVYSRITPYATVVRDGHTGLLAGDVDAWLQAVKALLEEPERRYRIALDAQEEVKRNWLLSEHLSDWEAVYQMPSPKRRAPRMSARGAALWEMGRQVQRHLGLQRDTIRTLREENRSLNEEILSLRQQIAALQIDKLRLDEILASRSWKFVRRLQKWRERLVPVNSRRERFVLRSVSGVKHVVRRAARRSSSLPSSTDMDRLYAEWIRWNEPGTEDLRRQRAQIAELPRQPLISIVTPVYNPYPAHLTEMLRSVREQTYPHWELCVADGNSSDPTIRRILEQAMSEDDRIRVRFLDANRGIAENTNAALAMARGEFIAFLDHDDTLAPFALYEVAAAVNRVPAVDMLYSDHDLLSEGGEKRFSPLFKPDWSPEIMLSANYITHLTVIRKSRIEQVGYLRSAFDGAQDWDLFLRVAERSGSIVHIPAVLYHWRDTVGSTAGDIHRKQYAPKAQLRAIREHLQRQGMLAPDAFFTSSGFIRVRWHLKAKPRISIIIPSNGANTLLRRCVESIREKTRYPDYEVVIVNNGEKTPEQFAYYAHLSRDARFRVIHDGRKPFNYSAVNNRGAASATGEVLVFLNNDTVVLSEDWLDEFAMWTERPSIGVVGAKLLLPDRTIQHAGVIVGLTGFAGHVFAGLPEGQGTIFGFPEWYRNYLALTAACFAVRRGIFERLGGFNENLALCGNDVDLCLRVREAGYRNVYNPFIRLMHEESATRDGPIPDDDYRESYRCYHPFLERGDPYYNKNLSLWNLVPTLKVEGETPSQVFAVELLRKLSAVDSVVDAE